MCQRIRYATFHFIDQRDAASLRFLEIATKSPVNRRPNRYNVSMTLSSLISRPTPSWYVSLPHILGGVYIRKLAPAGVSYRNDFFYFVSRLHHIHFEGTLHVDKIHVRFKIINITHALPVPVYRQTDFTPKRVVISCLHDTVVRFRTGMKFSPRYSNRGDSRRHGILWWYHVNKCRAMRGNRSELTPA